MFLREELLRDVWKYDFFGGIRIVDTHKRVRKELAAIMLGMELASVWRNRFDKVDRYKSGFLLLFSSHLPSAK